MALITRSSPKPAISRKPRSQKTREDEIEEEINLKDIPEPQVEQPPISETSTLVEQKAPTKSVQDFYDHDQAPEIVKSPVFIGFADLWQDPFQEERGQDPFGDCATFSILKSIVNLPTSPNIPTTDPEQSEEIFQPTFTTLEPLQVNQSTLQPPHQSQTTANHITEFPKSNLLFAYATITKRLESFPVWMDDYKCLNHAKS